MRKTIIIIGTLVIALSAVIFIFVKYQKPAVDLNRPIVVTSFYPYYFLASEIMNGNGTVYNLTPAGSEPHDYELTSRDRALIEKSDLLIMNGSHLEPWADGSSSFLAGKRVIVASNGKVLNSDPHVWLDPNNMIEIANDITNKLIEIDPKNTNAYRANSSNLISGLYALDQAYQTGLSNCEKRDIITAHQAFSYPARRYNFNQISISGLSPESEPGAQTLAEITKIAKEKSIGYIFFESLIGPKLATTIAKEVGAKTLVLNPLEGLSDEEIKSGKNYISEMANNLTNLKTALLCQ